MDLYDLGVSLVLGAAFLMASAAVWQRLQLSLAKHPSLGGHLRMSKRFANWLPAYSYPQATWFCVDGAPEAISKMREAALARLGQTLKERSPQTLAHTAQAKPMISDMQLTSQYRMPYQFREVLTKHLQLG